MRAGPNHEPDDGDAAPAAARYVDVTPPVAAGDSPATADRESAVQVRGLVKSYGEVNAVRGIDFDIGRGEIFALLGPNGAGKTTTVEILEGYRTRNAGDVLVLGLDPARHRAALKPQVGIVLQATSVDRYLTVAESIAMYASYYPHPRSVGEVIDLVGLAEKRHTRVIKLSGGQQRRLEVAIALAGDPDLLFLDEPTTGFDPSARHEAWEVIKNLASLGKTVLLTTHYMDEAQALADRVAVIADGRIVAEGPPSTLAGRHKAAVRVRFGVPPGEVPPAELSAVIADGVAEFSPTDLAQALHKLSGWAMERRVPLDSLEILRPSLEDVYLELTGPAEAGTQAGGPA